MITFPDDVKAAYSRSKNIIRKTPLDHSPSLSNIIDGDVYLKLDNIQKTGSFKFRGAISKMTSLPAACFGLKHRGVLKSGNYADLVIFDPDCIADTATKPRTILQVLFPVILMIPIASLLSNP